VIVQASSEFEITISESAKAYQDINELLNDGAITNTVTLTAFVSCYNERNYIIQTLDDICNALMVAVPNFEIIVIDDCSKDDSASLIQKYIENHPNINIILRRNKVNRGLAQNFIEGAFLGRGEYYKLFCGDNTEPPASIIAICTMAGKADIIIPNYSNVEGKHGFRLWLSNTYTTLVNFVSGNKIQYYNGLHLHKRHNIMRWHPNTRGFGFQADIICMLLEQGASYTEVSVPAVNHAVSRALTWRNILSVGHTLLDIMIRRIARKVYGRF
jgi:glycosyltransferase involved in cell wall biosynthesis